MISSEKSVTLIFISMTADLPQPDGGEAYLLLLENGNFCVGYFDIDEVWKGVETEVPVEELMHSPAVAWASLSHVEEEAS